MEQTERAEGLILNLAESVQNGTHQTVVYKHEGAGTVAIVSAAVAVLCVLFVIGGAIVMDGEITRSEARVDGRLRDLEAWRGVHATKIQNLENLQKGTGK
jgi:hypothetical protein